MQLTQAGLAMALSERLRKVEFIDLEPLIITARPRGQRWNVKAGGHWNANAHRKLSVLLK